MHIDVIPVKTKKQLRQFIRLPWEIYQGNPCFVPPMMHEMKAALRVHCTTKSPTEQQALFLALLDQRSVGRIFVSYDAHVNQVKKQSMGYFSLFECIDHSHIAATLFKAAVHWLKTKGITSLHGPFGMEGVDSDEGKGLLMNAYDQAPYLMNTYNPPYYPKLLSDCGFEKDYDVFAYHLDAKKVFSKNPEKALAYAQKKYHFEIAPVNLKKLDTESVALKYVLDRAVPDEWPDLVAPSLGDVKKMAVKLRPIADPNLILIARSGNEPIGFGIALPDYNQVLLHMNGRRTPYTLLKYFWYKRKISQSRIFVMFVIPAFRNKGVSYAIYYNLFKNCIKKGYLEGEGSTIGETNLKMRKDIERFGGEHYKTYRIYKKDL